RDRGEARCGEPREQLAPVRRSRPVTDELERLEPTQVRARAERCDRNTRHAPAPREHEPAHAREHRIARELFEILGSQTSVRLSERWRAPRANHPMAVSG